MIVLVDTSVWIHFLANRPPYAGALDPLLGRDEVSGQAPLVPHTEVVQFVREGRLHGRGIGWIDAHLLASALVGRLMLWTADPRLAAVARELKIAYD